MACLWSPPSRCWKTHYHFLFRWVALVTTWTPQPYASWCRLLASPPHLSLCQRLLGVRLQPLEFPTRPVKDIVMLWFLRISSSSTSPLPDKSACRGPLHHVLPNVSIRHRTLLLHIWVPPNSRSVSNEHIVILETVAAKEVTG